MMSKMCEAEGLIGAKGRMTGVIVEQGNYEGCEMKSKCRSWISRGEGGNGL